MRHRALTPADSDPRARWVVEWLRTSDLARPARFDDLARSVHLSPSRLRYVFKQEVGVTPAKFLKLLRFEKARQLLQTSFLEVKEVAAMVGLADVSHFVRDYKSLYGETPSETRYRSKAG